MRKNDLKRNLRISSSSSSSSITTKTAAINCIRPCLELYQPPNARLHSPSSSSSSSSAVEAKSKIFNKFVHIQLHSNSGSEFSSNKKQQQQYHLHPQQQYHHQQQQQNNQKANNKTTIMKSALKRSKSFGFRYNSNEKNDEHTLLNEIEVNDLTMENQILIRRALDNPNSLVMTQIMEIVRILCNKAIQKTINSHSMGKIAINIIEKEKCTIFIDSLLNCLREWFNERDKLLRNSNVPPTRWTAYVAFLTELYLCNHYRRPEVRFQSTIISSNEEEIGENYIHNCYNASRKLSNESIDNHRINNKNNSSSKSKNNNASNNNNNSSNETDDEYRKLLILKQFRSLGSLIYDCCQEILSTLHCSNSVSIDIECIQNVLRTVGKHLEKDNYCRMNQLISQIRDIFLCNNFSQILSSSNQRSLMEIIEYRESKWTFSPSQQLYYFPYTKLL